jgi:hypothetical protein
LSVRAEVAAPGIAVTSRKTPFWRAGRPLAAALALASLVAASPSRGQDADLSTFQLRGADQADASAPAATPTTTPSAPDTTAANSADNVLDNGAAGRDQSNGAGQTKRKPKKRTDLLPPLEPYRKAARIGLPGGPPQIDPAVVPPPSVAALPTPPPKRKPKPDENPFDPVGISVGDLRLTPYVEQDIGFNTNPNFVSGPVRGSWFESTNVGLGFQSDWSRSELHGTLHGGYTDYFEVPSANTPAADAKIGGRFDVSRDLSIDYEGRFLLGTLTPGSTVLPTGVVLATNQRPLWETYGATLGATQKFGDFSFGLHGLVDRISYQNTTFGDGSINNLASDNYTDWALNPRIAYQISPIIKPFVESVVDTRRYDDAVDSSGFARTSDGVLGRAGATIAPTDKLSGEISAGYGERHYQDPRLPILAAPLFDASLTWAASALTKLTFNAASSLSETTVPGASGAVSRLYSIEIDHALRRYLTVGLTASLGTDDFVGVPQNDRIATLALKVDYNITRDIVLRASVSRQQYTINVPNSNYNADIFQIGLKLQR